MKRAFREVHLSRANMIRLQQINTIIEEYLRDGYVLTLRQLYYQLVSRDIIPNKQAEYDKLSTVLKEGRMSGIVDWSAIEDRMRKPHIPYYVAGKSEAIADTINQYRLDRQTGQDVYIEVWVEKDALSGVLSRVTDEYHIRLMVNRGYSSVSSMYDAHKRFMNAIQRGQNCQVLYLGDHDPSGLDMIRDINDRSLEFLNYYGVSEDRFNVSPIALTMQQIKTYDPPPNPAKVTDPRAKDYIAEHGRVSWEVDALNPKTLNLLVKSNIESLIDMTKFQEIVEREKKDKEILRAMQDQFESTDDGE